MNGMRMYFLSRAALSALLGLALAAGGVPWWAAIAGAGIVFALFRWAPRSGRYTIDPGEGVTALRRDERGQAISDRAARTAFVVLMLGLMVVTLYYGSGGRTSAPTSLLAGLLALGTLAYFAADVRQRSRA